MPYVCSFAKLMLSCAQSCKCKSFCEIGSHVGFEWLWLVMVTARPLVPSKWALQRKLEKFLTVKQVNVVGMKRNVYGINGLEGIFIP